ncbi:hypothetical protein K4K56_010882 [Colletotrichum sp. SAR 10_98]|nr:hypothetical protein K4K56_010882 [Colletotrichum sp. SAR 10_98]
MAPASRFCQLWEDLLLSPPAPVSRLDQLWEESLCPEYTIRRIALATKDTPQPFRCVPLDDRMDVNADTDPAREEREQRARSAVIQARNKADLESRIGQLQTLCNSNSGFFRMPKEVRDMIYDFVLLEMPRQEFIDLELANTRYSRWKSSRLRRLLEVCRLFKDELLSRFLALNIVRMSLYASDFSDKLGIRRGAKIVASAHVFMAFLERVRRFALHHERSDRPFWKDTTAKAGLLLANSMPQLQELTIYPTEETTHRDGDFLFFVLQVLTSPSLNKLIFFDTFDVVKEGDFEKLFPIFNVF